MCYKYSDGFRDNRSIKQPRKNVNSEVIKTRKGRKKKTDNETLPTISEGEENDIRDKRKRLVACVLSSNSKQYLGKEYTEQQINEMDSNYIKVGVVCLIIHKLS